MEWKAGDTVRLKSGGPRMTIQEIGTMTSETLIVCAWFENTTVKRDKFEPEMLVADDGSGLP